LGIEGALAERVARRTSGNPLFAVQLVGDWVSRGLLEPSQGGFRLTQGAKVDLPEDENDLEFIGLMDDLMIFKRTLLPAEIATLYAWGNAD
jgi:hypothetical protein